MSEPRWCPRAEDAVAFALHALEPDEEAALGEHLVGCPSCQAIVADTELTIAGLAAGVEQVDPPARLRDNILALAAHTPQDESNPPTTADTNPSAARPERAERARSDARDTETQDADTRGIQTRAAGIGDSGIGDSGIGGSGPGRSAGGLGPQRRRGTSGPERRRRLAGAALALVAVLAVAGVGGLAAYTMRLQQQRDAQIAQTQALAAQSRALVEVLTQLDRPGTSHTTLATSEGQPVAAVVTTPSERMVMAAGLPANDHTSNIYVLWGVSTDSAPKPIGTFDVDPAGPGPLVRELPLPDPGPESFLGYAISLEPGRVAPPAPSTVVASGQV